MKSIYKLLFTALAFSLPLASCSDDDDDYAPGEEVSADCASVYFPMQSAYSYTFSSDDAEKNINLVVRRLKSAGALSVPVTLISETQGFTSASTIEFVDGETETTFSVNCESIPVKNECSVTVSIPDSYVNPYAEGTSSVTVKSIVADWELWAPGAVFTFSNYYGSVTSDIYAMPGTRNIKIENFIGSGLPLQLEVEDIDYNVTAYARLFPLNNCDPYVNYYPEDAFDCWYFLDSANEEWPQWSPDGVGQPEIQYALCYGYDAESNYKYTYILPQYFSGCFTFYFDYSDGTGGYDYVNFTYERPLFEMFDDYGDD